LPQEGFPVPRTYGLIDPVMSSFVNRNRILQPAEASKRWLLAVSITVAATLGNASLPLQAQQTHQYTQTIVEQLGKAQVAADSGQLASAKAQYDKIIKADPACPEAYAGLGHVYLLMGHYADAEQPLNEALKLQPENANVYNGLGNAAYRQGHYAQAITNFEEALKYATEDTYKIHANLANALSDSHRVDDALKHFALAIDQKPDYAPAYNGLATMYYNNKLYDKAIQNARKAVSLKPDYAMGYYNLGIALIQKNQVTEARQALNDSLKYEKNPSYQQDTRRILAKLDSGQQAAAVSTIGASAGNSAVGHEIEQMLKDRQWQESESAIDTELKSGSDRSPTMWNNLGYAQMHAYAQSHDRTKFKQAKTSFEKAIALSGGHNAAAHYNLGQLYRMANDSKSAETQFRRSIDDAKLSHQPAPLAQTALGILLRQKNDLAGADACYRKALMDADGNLPVVHYNRAIVLERMEHSREAVNEYKAYLTRSPNGVNAKQAQLRLKMLGVDPG
jgi:tetratricopeptide (TPR) repeat protein